MGLGLLLGATFWSRWRRSSSTSDIRHKNGNGNFICWNPESSAVNDATRAFENLFNLKIFTLQAWHDGGPLDGWAWKDKVEFMRSSDMAKGNIVFRLLPLLKLITFTTLF